MKNYKLSQVFGVIRGPILSYLERVEVDGIFKDALETDQHIVVYGSSKQGKTSLVQKYLSYNDNPVITLAPNFTTEKIYQTILYDLGVQVASISTSKKQQKNAIDTSVGVKPMGIGLEGNFNHLQSEENEVQQNQLLDLSLADNVVRFLNKKLLKKVIILENFHYLSEEVQRQLAFDLRAFHDKGLRFVILGVWREKNRLNQFNGDLVDRIAEVPVEPWRKEDCKKVLEIGANYLNISFSDKVIEDIIDSSYDSIGVIQELAKSTCKEAGIESTSARGTSITNRIFVENGKKKKAQEYKTRHQKALESFATGLRATNESDSRTSLMLPYYFVKAILNMKVDGIENGITVQKLEREIKKIHHLPEKVRKSDMTNLLKRIGQIQNEKGITPPIFDYDNSVKTVKIIDSTFYFFIRNADIKEVSENIETPVEAV